MVKMKNIALVLAFVSWFDFGAAKYPSDLKRCHYGDIECLKKTIAEYAVKYRSGRRDMGLVPIDPLQIDEVSIEQGNQSPVTINLKFKDLKCHGLSNAKVKNVIGFGKDPATSKFEIYSTINRISLVGTYKARGNILLLPIFGQGPANLTIDDIDASIKFVPKVEVKKGKKHLRIVDFVLDFTTTRLWMNFDGLFNGDQVLSESTNTFLNDNWAELLTELKPVLIKAIGGIFKAVAEPIFNKFPYEDLFLSDDE